MVGPYIPNTMRLAVVERAEQCVNTVYPLQIGHPKFSKSNMFVRLALVA